MDREPKQNRKKGSILPSVLFLLALTFAVSTGMLGFVLGRSASGGTGELMDTIVLSPDRGVSGGEEVTHFLSGRVLYPEGSPCAGATVRLKNSDKTDETDDRGKFFFSDIRAGSHTVEVLDSQGRLMADSSVTLSFQEGGEIHTDVTAEPVFELPANTRMLEVTLTVDETASSLEFEKDGYVITAGGDVADFSGRMMESRADGYSVLPGGDVVSSSGYAMLPSEAVLISPGGSVLQTEELTEEETAQAGMALQANGEVLLGDGTVVKPGGAVEGQEGTVGPALCMIRVENGSVQEVSDLPDASPAQEDPQSTASLSESSQSEGSSLPAGSEGSSLPAAGPSPLPDGDTEASSSVPEESAVEEIIQNAFSQENALGAEPTPTPTPGPFSVRGIDSGNVWSQKSIVDLFAHRVTGAELGEREIRKENGDTQEVPVIAPGSSGYYDFKLKNDADYDIRFTLKIYEQTFHLPILYSVEDLETGRMYKGGSKTGANVSAEDSAIETKEILLPAHSERRYRLGWDWQYEDWLSPWEDDVYDTKAAAEENPTYMVGIEIQAEEVIPFAAKVESGTRYPGETKY